MMAESGIENPQAFPCPETELSHGSWGMSLLDWFAGQALAGEIASMGNDTLSIASGETVERALERDAARRAEWCYRQADALLAERAKRGTEARAALEATRMEREEEAERFRARKRAEREG